MTIYDYFDELNLLRIRSEKALERYEREYEKANSPRSSMNIYDVPIHRTAVNSRERTLISLADYREKYIKASRKYIAYRNSINYYVSFLPALDSLIIKHMIIKCEDSEKVSKLLGIRERELNEFLRKALVKLRAVMKENNVDIE